MILAFLLFLLLAIPVSAQGVWNGSTNTDWYTSNPSATEYTITTAEQLAGLAELVNGGNNFWNKTVKLGANIVLNENSENYESWSEEANKPANEWVAIGINFDYSFRGTFDGNGYVVSGVYINAHPDYQGLFGYLGIYGVIKNVGIVDSYIKGVQYVGGLVGYNNYGVISNSYSTSTVTGYWRIVGGLVGSNDDGSIINCYSTGIVAGGDDVGGLVGLSYLYSGIVSNSYYDSEISGQTDTGKGKGKTTEEMQNQAFANLLNIGAAIQSKNAWVYEEGKYPVLSNTPANAINFTSHFASGNGTEASPYIITTKEHLENLSFFVNLGKDFNGEYLKLDNDIILNNTENWQNWDEDNKPTYEWIAIGNSTSQFRGTFDGDNHIVSGVYVNTERDVQGLFGSLDSEGTIKNLGVVNSYIRGSHNVGGLVGGNYGGTVSNSHVIGAVTGGGDVGGLVGFNSDGIVINSYSTGVVAGYGDVGGLVGANYSSTIINSYSTGTVTGSNSVGGLVGYNSSGTVNNSYSTGEVVMSPPNAFGKIGGLVGDNDNHGTVNSSYYDTETSGQSDYYGIGKTTEEMQSQAFVDSLNVGAAALSLNAWVYEEGKYPILSNEPAATIDIVSYFESGDGTEANPYIITTKKHLENLSFFVNLGKSFNGEYFKLGNDIALNNTENWQNWDEDNRPANEWIAIGNSISKFRGAFDGDGHVISGVYINAYTDFQGLFGYLGSGGTIKNIGVVASYVKGGSYADWAGYVGGLVGMNDSGTVSNSYSIGIVSGDILNRPSYYIGGLVGYNNYGVISNCYSTGAVEGHSFIGGLVGYNNSGTVSNSYSTGTVTGGNSVGGLVGFNDRGTVSNSYSANTVNGSVLNNIYYNNTGNYTMKTTAEMQSEGFVNLLNIGATILSMNAWNYSAGKYPVLSSEPANFNFASYFASGNGTEANPYIIKTKDHLESLSLFVNLGKDFNSEHFKLDNDIALSGTEANPWTAIGNSTNRFKGTFDGNGHVISGVYINSTSNYQGLFGCLGSGGTIKNLGVTNSYVKATGNNSNVGGLAGISYGTIINSYSTGTVTATGSGSVGGLVGYNYKGGIISNSYSASVVTGKGYFVGGLVGDNSGTVINSYYDSQTSGKTDTGKGTRKTTAAMKQIATYTGWDFRGLWNISSTVNNGYPYLNIRIKTPIAADLSFTIPTDHIYNGTQQGIGNVTGIAGMGAITVLYNGSATIPTNAGTYAVTVNIAEGTEFTAIESLSLGSYTISEATPIISHRVNPSIGSIGVQTIGNAIVLTNLPSNAKVEVFGLNGKRVGALPATPINGAVRITVQTKGVYVVKSGGQSLRVVVR